MYPSLNIFPTGEQLLQAFSWTLIHSMWQGLLLAITAAALLQLLKKAGSALRYNIIFFHLLAFVSACIVSFIRELDSSPVQPVPQLTPHADQTATSLFNLDTGLLIQLASAGSASISQHAHLLVMIWALFFAFRSLRMVQGLRYLRKAKHTQIYGIPEEWQSRFRQLSERLRISKPVQLLESGFVQVPIVIGHMKPIILMPAGLLTGLPAQQVEAVLLHELAHIRRHDYVVNLLQTICETIFFFNPALLWLSSLLRDEREHCCDDIALQQTGNKREFIEALISFKEHTLYPHHAAVAFPGKKNQLLQRVSRIISNKHQPPGIAEKVCFMAGIMLLAVMLSAATITKVNSKTTAGKQIVIPATNGTATTVTASHNNNREAQDTIPERITAPAAVQHTLIPPTITVTQADPAPQPEPPVVTEVTMRYEEMRDDVDEGHIAEMSPKQRMKLRQEALAARHEEELQARRLSALEKQNNLHERATLDRIQAEKDRAQADLDRAIADKDRRKADEDRIQADKDRQQADADRKQAALDRQWAEKERQQAERDRLQYGEDKKQYEHDRMPYEKDRLQADADKEHTEKERMRFAPYRPAGKRDFYQPATNQHYNAKPI